MVASSRQTSSGGTAGCVSNVVGSMTDLIKQFSALSSPHDQHYITNGTFLAHRREGGRAQASVAAGRASARLAGLSAGLGAVRWLQPRRTESTETYRSPGLPSSRARACTTPAPCFAPAGARPRTSRSRCSGVRGRPAQVDAQADALAKKIDNDSSSSHQEIEAATGVAGGRVSAPRRGVLTPESSARCSRGVAEPAPTHARDRRLDRHDPPNHTRCLRSARDFTLAERASEDHWNRVRLSGRRSTPAWPRTATRSVRRCRGLVAARSKAVPPAPIRTIEPRRTAAGDRELAAALALAVQQRLPRGLVSRRSK